MSEIIYRLCVEDAKGNIIARIDKPSNQQAKSTGEQLIDNGKAYRYNVFRLIKRV